MLASEIVVEKPRSFTPIDLKPEQGAHPMVEAVGEAPELVVDHRQPFDAGAIADGPGTGGATSTMRSVS